MKFYIIFSVIFSGMLFCHANTVVSHYKNNEKHIAKELDINNVPVDPNCKFRTVWENVTFDGLTRAGIPAAQIKHLTIVKFNYAGAWVAWTDEDGYHEPLQDDYIPWSNFPKEIKKYYEPFCIREWNGVKEKKNFFMRTPQVDPNAKKLKDKRSKVIQRRYPSGVVSRDLFNNARIPFSELPLEIRTKCGFYENESYIPAMPVLDKPQSTLNDKILFVPSSGLRVMRRFKEGSLVRVMLKINGIVQQKDIFVQKFKGVLEPNHKSDLHIFKSNNFIKTCEKCNLSDHLNERFFNFMFDRQSRTPCPVPTIEYAFVKKGTQKVGRITVNSYQFMSDHDKKYPRDSVQMLGNKKIPIKKK